MTVMNFQVMLAAKPANVERLRVILVMHFGLRCAANLTRFSLQLSASFVGIGDAARLSARDLFWARRVRFPPLANVGRMALEAIAAGRSPRLFAPATLRATVLLVPLPELAHSSSV